MTTASPADRRLRRRAAARAAAALAAVWVWMAAGAAPAVAQTPAGQTDAEQTDAEQTDAGRSDPGRSNAGQSAPVRLFPGLDGAPAPQPDAAPAPPSSGVIGSGPEAVEVAPLTAPAADAVGLIDSASGGLPADMWTGAPRLRVHQGLLGLPTQSRTLAGRTLAIRFLTSAAPAPGDAADPPAGDILAARIDALVALGALQAATGLAEISSRGGQGPLETPALTRARAEAHLAAGALPAACTDARPMSQRSDAPFWQKLLIACQAAAGQTGEAEFGLGLLVEMGVDDPLFLTIADAMIAGRAPDLSASDPGAFTALTSAMARALGAQPPAAVAMQGSAPAVAALAATAPQALALAEAAAWRGALDPARLAELYAGADFDKAQLDSPLSAADALDGARARALLYQSLSIQTVPAAKAELLTAAFRTAARDGLYPLAAAVFADHLAQVPPETGLSFFAETAARALYAAGSMRAAERWRRLIEARAMGESADAGAASGPMTAAGDRLWALGRLAGTIPMEEGGAGRLAAWERRIAARAPEQAGDLMLRVLLPLAALEPADDSLTDALFRRARAGDLVEATTANPAAGALMGRAAAEGRVGETVLFALYRLGGLPAADMEPTSLAEIAAALAAVGLEAEGRRLALESAVAAGL